MVLPPGPQADARIVPQPEGAAIAHVVTAYLLLLGPEQVRAAVTQSYGVGGVPQGTSLILAPETTPTNSLGSSAVMILSATAGGLDATLVLTLFLPFDTPLSFWSELLSSASGTSGTVTTDFSNTAEVALFIQAGVGYTTTGPQVPIFTLDDGAQPVPEPATLALVAFGALGVVLTRRRQRAAS